MIPLEVEELNSGYQIRHLHRDRPPKVKLGPGYRFFTNSRFGDLVLFGKLTLEGKAIEEACDQSGVSLFRAKRFLKSLGRPCIYKKVCDICKGTMAVTTRRQKRHPGSCRTIYKNRHRRNYPQYHKKQHQAKQL